MSSASSDWGPSHQGCNIDQSHHRTFYRNYTNQGYHASEGGVINVNYYQSSHLPPNHINDRALKQPKRRLTDAGAPDHSKKQRVGDFVKITLDIAKESAYFGHPLKAALAGMSALVKYYEEFEGVKDEIEGLQSQLDRLEQNITTTTIDGEPEETGRRTELISMLGEIEKRSQELLEKGRATGFVDKGRYSEEVARLVDQFREAITHYQISQQQAIYGRIADLTSSFNTLLKLEEKSPAVKNKLDSILGRLDRLCAAEDSNEHERLSKLFNTLRLIRDNGNVLYNRVNAPGYEVCEDDIQAASGIAEDIQDGLLDYQISQQRAIYDQNCKLIDAVDLAVLNNCLRARGAAYQHGNRRGCLRGTREAVLNEIELWIKDWNKSSVFWLNGLAGTGKSTIAQTIAERAFADGLLGASFFCSRDFEDRSGLHFIFPTLAFQLAHKYASFRAHLVPLLQSNPDVVYESLYSQMERLIVEPLQSAEISTVIVVDALDECKDDEPSSAILSVLARLVERIPRVKFFITGRPEPRIKTGFRLPLLEDATKVFVLHEVHPDLINNDILLFLKHELSELALRRRLEGWPSDEHISILCQRAAGLFVYAVATIKFLDSKTHLPNRRLDVIVNLPECTVPEGKTQFKPRTTLDSLYMSVLQMAFSEEDPEVDSKVRSIIGAVVLLLNPLSLSAIAEITNLDPQEVLLLLTSVQSLLVLDEDLTHPVKSFHKSFPDFVTDPSRCLDTRFYISPENLHLELAINCLRMLNNGLEQNLLSLPDYDLNSEVKDLQTRIDSRISVALRYACQSWHNHLTKARGDVTEVISCLRLFLEEKFLAWLEVLSVLNVTRGAAVALEKLMAWLPEVSRDDQLLDTARDCFYFGTEFFEPINVSATHIYHSALELSPLSSIIRKLYYHRRLTPFPRVEIGILDSRDPNIAIDSGRHCSTWSPCGQFVAIQGEDAVKIRDALTFELVSTLRPATRRNFFAPDSPSYSPDGHSLACITTTTGITIWDIQTGGVAKKIQCDLGVATKRSSLVWSDGGIIGVLCGRTVNMYNVAPGIALSPIKLESSCDPYLWAHNESFRVMTTAQDSETTTIDIFEIGLALTKIESFSIQLKERDYSITAFSPTAYHVSVLVWNFAQLVILDIRNLERKLLDEKGDFLSQSNNFSSDGSRFAVSSRQHTIHIWNYDGGCYIPWRQFPSTSSSSGAILVPILFSPTSSSVLVDFLHTTRIWRLDSPPTPATHHQQLHIFSHSGTHIANAHYHRRTITITKLLSQTPSQFIDTGIKIAGLGLTGNVLLVKGPDVVVAWLLTEEWVIQSNALDNRRAGRSDSIWSVSAPKRFRPKFSIEGETGVIKCGKTLHTYNSRTGKVLEPAQELSRFNGSWYSFDDTLQAQDHHCNNSVQIAPPKYKWKPSNTTWTKEWLKDRQGKSLLWLPIDWRIPWRRNVTWFPDISTIKFQSDNKKPVIIKLH